MSDRTSSVIGEEVQSKFTVLEKPTLHPGHCICCGAVDRPVLEFGVDVDFDHLGYGRLMLCVTCIKQAASKFPDDKIQPRVMAVDEWNSWKQELLDELTGVITANQLPPGILLDTSISEQTESGDTQDTKRDESESSGPIVETNSTNSFEGATGVSGNTGDGDTPFGLDFGNL